MRMGRNPKTGVDAPISPRRVVVFKASAILKQRLNDDDDPILKKVPKEESVPAGNAGTAET
jgi:integration host factor subunit alpha